MSIIIENKDDIELLLDFFRLFNVPADKVEAETDDDLRDRVNQIDKWIVEQADAKKNFARELLAVKSELKNITEK